MANESQLPLLFDWAGNPAPSAGAAPITSRPTQALYNYQGGLLTLGSDYGATAKAQSPKVDSAGTQYVTAVGAGGATIPVYTGQLAPISAANQVGSLMFGRQDGPSPSDYQPLLIDAVGAVAVSSLNKPTFRAVVKGVTCSTNLVLLSLMNGSTSKILRIASILVYVPPQGSATGGNIISIGTSTTYYPLFCELYRISAQSKGSGTVVGPIAADSGDILDTGVTVYSQSTTTGTTLLYRRDAIPCTMSGQPWYNPTRDEKAVVVRPSEGVSLVCTSNGTIASGTTTTVASVDVVFTFTLAAA